jgi:hypothetical protein
MDKKDIRYKKEAELYYNLFLNCVKYRQQNKHKDVRCNYFYKQFQKTVNDIQFVENERNN